MKKLLSFLFFAITAISIFAQGSYTIKYYTYYNKPDSSDKRNVNYLYLAINDSQSVTYYQVNLLKYKIAYPLGSALLPKATYYNINKKLLLGFHGFPDKPKKQEIIVFDFPETKWNITTETKVILGDTCIKATGVAKGRQRIVYYSPKLPVGFGPNIDFGLPGTVLEIFYPDIDFHIVAVSIEKSSPDIVEPTFAKRISEKKFKNRQQNNNVIRIPL